MIRYVEIHFNWIWQKLLSALAELETLKPDVQRQLAEINRKPAKLADSWAQPHQNGFSDPYVWPPVNKPAPLLQQHVQVLFFLPHAPRAFLQLPLITPILSYLLIAFSTFIFGLKNDAEPPTQLKSRNIDKTTTKFWC